jgi:hypothetical protein
VPKFGGVGHYQVVPGGSIATALLDHGAAKAYAGARDPGMWPTRTSRRCVWMSPPKIAAADVAEQTMQALIEDRAEVLADEATRRVKAALGQPPAPEAP